MKDIGNVSTYLADNITSLRTQNGLSQARLADKAGIPRSTLTHMESGGGNPSLANLCKLAAALGVGVSGLPTYVKVMILVGLACHLVGLWPPPAQTIVGSRTGDWALPQLRAYGLRPNAATWTGPYWIRLSLQDSEQTEYQRRQQADGEHPGTFSRQTLQPEDRYQDKDHFKHQQTGEQSRQQMQVQHQDQTDRRQ